MEISKSIFVRFFVRLFVQKIYYKIGLSAYGNLLILAPHPDDEILGLGGIILQTLQRGGKVYLVYLTDGEGSGVSTEQEEIKCQRIALSEMVCERLGLESSNITRLHLPDGSVPHPGQSGYSETVQRIKNLIDQIKPDAVFATHTLDYWPYDHVACAHISHEAVKQSTSKPQLYYYWVWAWYNLQPWQLFKLNYKKINRVDISAQLAEKMELTGIYLNSLTSQGKPWSGVLPRALLAALNQPFEIIEKTEIK
jgi:LmbE family N-acetylglucosaminyl deacetylase